MWGRLRCWLLDMHVPEVQVRTRPTREVLVCQRCRVLLVDDPWDSDRFDEPRID